MAVWKTLNYAEEEEKEIRINLHKTLTKHEQRTILSEAAINSILPWHFEKGEAYHVLSLGDIDSLTFFRLILKEQKVEYALISTWKISRMDIEEIGTWLEAGNVGRIDFYIGEILQSAFKSDFAMLTEICKKHNCRLVSLKNHSKIICAFGEKYNVVVESSANMNTNPRIEQTTITIDDELAKFYKKNFDSLLPLNKDYKQPPKYELRLRKNG